MFVPSDNLRPAQLTQTRGMKTSDSSRECDCTSIIYKDACDLSSGYQSHAELKDLFGGNTHIHPKSYFCGLNMSEIFPDVQPKRCKVEIRS